MAASLELCCLFVLFMLFPQFSAFSHWVVTEDGKIQSQADSVFNLRRPYDLMALIKQEERSDMLDKLKTELLLRKEEIDRNEDRDTGLEQRFYKEDSDCVAAGKPLPEFDLYISTVLPLENKAIRPQDHIDFKAPPATIPMPPYCTTLTTLEYSIHAFEHLEGMKNRQNLSGSPELGLKNAITHRENVDDYGNLVYEAMKKNKTSWVLYNMAAFYWRIKGEPYNVVECVRRALHYSPRTQKDVALISLANILHRARYSSEAAIVVHAALDVSKELNVNHFTLGNIYAVLAEYNHSVLCFDNTLKIQPDFEAARIRKHAVLCHSRLEVALEAQHNSLQKTLNDLKDYEQKHKFWQQQNEKRLSEQVKQEEQLDVAVGYEQQKIRESKVGIGEHCRMVERDGRQILKCSWGKKNPVQPSFEARHKTKDKTETHKPKQDKKHSKINYSKPIRPPRFPFKSYIPVTEEGKNKPWKAEGWPVREECDKHVQKFPAWTEFPTIYLSPENKGFEANALLEEGQGLKISDEHPLPWYPPVCVTLADIPAGKESYGHIGSVKDSAKAPMKLFPSNKNKPVNKLLLEHFKLGHEITEEEIGQRILTALKHDIGPKWVLYDMAALYWRYIGNTYHAIECLRRSIFFAPKKYLDVPLVNLANILYKWTQIDDAVAVMSDALNTNDDEPSSHFFYGNLLTAKGDLHGAVRHYETALKQDPDYTVAFTTLRILRCWLKFHPKKDSKVSSKSMPAESVCPMPKETDKDDMQNIESRIHCREEHGKEICVLETRTRQSKTNQLEICKQTCTADKGACLQKAIEQQHMPKGDCHNQPMKEIKTKTTGTKQKKVKSNKKDNKPAKKEKIVLPENPVFGTQFMDPNIVKEIYHDQDLCNGHNCDPAKARDTQGEELRELYRSSSICEGDCSEVNLEELLTNKEQEMVSKNTNVKQVKPHIKLEHCSGITAHNLLFDDKNKIDVKHGDCIVFNDGTQTEGCQQGVFTDMAEQLSDFYHRFDDINDMVENMESECAGELSESKQNQCKEKLPDLYTVMKNSKQTNKGKSIDVSEDNLPDTRRFLGPKPLLMMPTFQYCEEHKRTDFSNFMSTWLSVTAKGIQLSDHLDMTGVMKGILKEPVCTAQSEWSFGNLASLQNIESLKYTSEGGLKEVLQQLSGEESEPVSVVGARIAKALEKNQTSWVLGSLSALYWRVEGDVSKAIDCLRMSESHARHDTKDIPLLSVANILFKARQYNDAIFVMDQALTISPRLVVLHFTIANIYAAKRDWPKAAMFYESTLGLQESFKPALERLTTLQCKQILENPEYFNTKK